MNDRMAELFGQAGISDSINEEFGVEYLVKLIVKECAEICRSRKLTPSAFTADELLEHFGVENE